MPFDSKSMQKRKNELQRGNSFTPKEGATVLFFCDSGRPEDTVNFVETYIHYGLGPRRIPATCLDASRNATLLDPRVVAMAQEKGVDLKAEIEKGCPVCRRIYDQDGDEEKLQDMRPQKRFLFPVVPMKFKVTKGQDFQDLEPEIQIWNTSYTQFDRISDELVEIGDPTNVEAAVFITVKRTGTRKNDTKYTIETDKKSLLKPVKLPKPLRAMVRQAIEPGKEGDLYRAAIDLIRPADEVEALLTGIQVEQTKTEDVEEHQPCFGTEFSADDDECTGCAESDECEKAMKKTTKKAQKSETEDEPEDKPEDKPESDAGDDDADDEDSSGELDDLEEALRKRKGKKS